MPSPRNVDSWVEQVEHGSMPTALSAFLGFFHGPTKQDRENLGVRGASASGMTKKEMPEYKTLEQQVYNFISRYAKPDDLQATWHLVTTVVVWFSTFFAAYCYSGPLTYLVRFVCLIIAGLTRTRVFVVFHDMAHHNYFSSKQANATIATLLGTFCYTPYTGWKKGHDYHHRHSNNTDRKQYAQTAPLTVQQYSELPKWQQLMYRCIYGHWSLLTTTPTFYFMVFQRFLSTWYENALTCLWWGFILSRMDAWLIAVDLITTAIGGGLGVFLFHIQHTFEGAYKAPMAEYSRFENGMKGSSYLQIPEAIKWFTAGIEYHHIHHLNTRVPLYRIRQCHEEGGQLWNDVPTFTLFDAFQRLPHSLRDDDTLEFLSVYDHVFIEKATMKGKEGVGSSNVKQD